METDTEEQLEGGSNFHKNLIRTDSLKGELIEEDNVTIRDYNDYVCYRRKRAAIIGIIVVVGLAVVTFAIVYFTHIHPKIKGNQLEKCEQNQMRFQAVENKCFMYRDVQTREIMFKGSNKECMDQCFSSSHCRSVDFFLDDGECWLFTVTSQEVLWEWSETQKMSQLDVHQRRKLVNCMHYDRMCL